MSHCAQCGMATKHPREYHPYAACLMFMGCKDGDIVRKNLHAVLEYGAEAAEQKRLRKRADQEHRHSTANTSASEQK